MSTVMRWAFVGDLQIPYHDPRAVTLFMNVMKTWKPQIIDILGDIDDQLEYSRFSDGTTDEFFNQLKADGKANEKLFVDYEKAMVKHLDAMEKYDPESGSPPPLAPMKPERVDPNPLPFIYENARLAKQWYSDVRKAHPNADIHASLGNHDIRIFGYVDKKAPELNDQITPNTLWGLDDLGITWKMYSEKPFLRHGGLHVHHGATTSSSGAAVRVDMDNYDISLARGHDHQGGVVYKTFPLSGRRLQGLAAGHMCDPNAYGLQYAINPSWELGFGVGWVTGEHVQLQFIPITPDYTCVLNGRLFEG